MKLTNNQKRNALKKIIEMPTPSWLTHQVYKTHLEDFDYHSAIISDNDTVFIKNIGDMLLEILELDNITFQSWLTQEEDE